MVLFDGKRKTMAVLQNKKLHYDSRFLIEYGSINKKNPEVVYINYKTYLSSKDENEEYRIIINDVLKKFKRVVATVIKSSRFEKDYIFDYDILQDIQPIFNNKILTFELYLKQPEDDIIKVKNLKNCIEPLSRTLTDTLTEYLEKNCIELSKAKKH